jgi:lysophospholipid acyltransferase (LPLAT)-like uncharacterized protein
LALDYLEADLPQSWLWRAATWPLTLALSAWLLSLRHGSSVQCDGATPPAGPAVYVTWHRYSPLLVALLPPRFESLVVLGGPMPYVRPFRYALRLLGLGVVPITSRPRGTPALEQLAEEMQRGASVVITVDGPRGPAYRAKPGCVRLARAVGVPIVPVAFGGQGLSLGINWDRMHLPWPQRPLKLRFGEPFTPGEDMAAAVAEVDLRLHVLHASLGMTG